MNEEALVETTTPELKFKNYDHLGAILNGKFTQWESLRIPLEQVWLEDLRAFNGVIDTNPDVNVSSSPVSNVFVQLTRTKCLAALAALKEALFPAKGKHWSLSPTPVPELERGGVTIDPITGLTMQIPPEILRMQIEEAMRNMEREMDDQLEELNYDRIVHDMLLELCTIGTGVIKGVIPDVRATPAWQANPLGQWNLNMNEQPFPRIEWVSVFDVYPDPYATDIRRATGIFERHVLTRMQFKELSENPKFDDVAINEILEAPGSGVHTERMHETARRTMAGSLAVASLEADRFDVLEYWGIVKGSDLERSGVEVVDPAADYYANVWTCAGRTLYASLSPLKRQELPYRFIPYEKVPHKLHGIGPARMIRDSQVMLNATVNTALDNMALASGPQVEVNTNVVAEGEDPRDVRPWKVWLRDGGDPAYPMLRFHQPESVVQALQNLVEMFRHFADEESNIPSYTHGQTMPGLTKTASGMSMMFSAAKISNNSVINNIDRYMITPLLTSLFDWNMEWNDKPEIKGDMRVVAKGSTTLMAKEVQSQRLIQFAQITANPIDMQVVNRAELIKEIASALDLNTDKIILEMMNYGQQPPIPQAPGAAPAAGQQPAMGGPFDLPDPAVGEPSTDPSEQQ